VKRHREAIVALDFFTVPTLTFHLLYGFFVIDHHWTKRDEKGTDAFPETLTVRDRGKVGLSRFPPTRSPAFALCMETLFGSPLMPFSPPSNANPRTGVG
jgi:hypothetical protein